MPTDVADEAAVRALIDGTVAAWGRLDVLVNNAGIGILATVDQTTAGRVRADRPRQLPRRRATASWPRFPTCGARARGHIVNVASVVGKRASPFRAAYVASKFALVGFSEALRMELLGSGIHVTCVCPIGTATEFHEVEPNRLGVPGRGGPIQSAEHVARGIVRALRRPRAEVHPYPPARLLFLANDARARPRRPPAPPPQPAGPRALTGATRRHVSVEQEVVDDLQHAARARTAPASETACIT